MLKWNFKCAYRSARDSKPLEVIGTYNPIPQKPTNLSEEEARVAKPFKEISIDRSRVKYWLGVGAQPSDSVWRLLSMVRRSSIVWMHSCEEDFSFLFFFFLKKEKLFWHYTFHTSQVQCVWISLDETNWSSPNRWDYLNPSQRNSNHRRIDWYSHPTPYHIFRNIREKKRERKEKLHCRGLMKFPLRLKD